MSTSIRNVATLMLALLIMLSMVVAVAVKPAQATHVTPKQYSGNFVSTDDQQVCYELQKLGYIKEVTSDMRGFKVDPPANYSDGYVDVTLSSDGKSLDWTSTGATVHAFIVKGANAYNVYDYDATALEEEEDTGLKSPVSKKQLPQISHYNVCYTPDPPAGDEGCTPGYWRNHADRWSGVAPNNNFDTIFGVNAFDPDKSLGQAVWSTGGGTDALARHATAALLNAYGGVPNTLDGEKVEYPYTSAQVIQMVQDALAEGGDIEATKDKLAEANELGCPLEGTRAVDAPQNPPQ